MAIRVASRSFSADPSDDVLALAADDAEIDGDGADATRLEFRAVDRYGAPRPYVRGQVGFDVTPELTMTLITMVKPAG